MSMLDQDTSRRIVKRICSERIVTRHICPPVPSKAFDWEATRESYEPGWPIGHGPTEQAAIDNLIEQEAV